MSSCAPGREGPAVLRRKFSPEEIQLPCGTPNRRLERAILGASRYPASGLWSPLEGERAEEEQPSWDLKSFSSRRLTAGPLGQEEPGHARRVPPPALTVSSASPFPNSAPSSTTCREGP